MSKARLALIEIWKKLCGVFRMGPPHHCHPGCELSHIREEAFEKIYRYGRVGIM